MKLAKMFFDLFAGLPRAHGTYMPGKAKDGTQKIDGKAVTLHEEVTVEKWKAHLEGKSVGLGVIPIMDDANVNWAAIDIDDYSIDHAKLFDDIAKLKLPLVQCLSKSGGAHLFAFFKEPVTAKLARSKLSEWSMALGKAGVEIFPKQIQLANKTDVGNWINMPYFQGDKTTRFCYFKGKKLSPERFIEYCGTKALTLEQLEAFTVNLEGKNFSDGPPCLQVLAAGGFPQGTRNMGLFNLGVYCRNKFGDTWKEELEEMNRTYMNPPLGTAEVAQAMRSLSRKTYFFTCDKQPVVQCCNKEICKRRTFGIGGAGEDIPVTIGQLTRINSEVPTFFIDVEGVRMEVTPQELLLQDRFRLKCVEKISKLPTRMKQPEWEAIVRDRLDHQEVVEAPPDAGPMGQFFLLLETFCTGRHKARAIDEILLGKPFPDSEDQRTYFRSMDLMKFLDQQHFREFAERQVWSALRDIGAKHGSSSLKGKCVQHWSIPSPAEMTEGFEKGKF